MADVHGWTVVTAFGESRSVTEWSKDARCRVTFPALLTRLRKGSDAEIAISTPRSRPKYDIRSGQRFGMLTAISGGRIECSDWGHKKTVVDCICECGKQVTKAAIYLMRGATVSCGCASRRGRPKVRTEQEKKDIQRQWRIKNRERRRTYIREWKRRNPGAVASHEMSRRAIKQWSEEDDDRINAIYALARSDESVACYLCGRLTTSAERHVDHMRPLSRGGLHIADNLGIACKECNLKKGAKLEYAAEG